MHPLIPVFLFVMVLVCSWVALRSISTINTLQRALLCVSVAGLSAYGLDDMSKDSISDYYSGFAFLLALWLLQLPFLRLLLRKRARREKASTITLGAQTRSHHVAGRESIHQTGFKGE